MKPQTDDGKMMSHFKARTWISESDYELVRVEIEADRRPLVRPGTARARAQGHHRDVRASQGEQRGLAAAKVTWTASARLLLVRRLRLRGIAEFSAYRKFSVDTDWRISEK